MKKNLKLRISRGMAVPLVLILITVAVVIAFALATIGLNSMNTSDKNKNNTMALYAGEAGISRGVSKLVSNYKWEGKESDGNKTFENISIGPEHLYYTVDVFNNFEGNNSDSGSNYMTVNNIVKVPEGSTFLLSTGKKGQAGFERATKKVGLMLKRTNPFSQFALLGKDYVTTTGTDFSVSAYDPATGSPVNLVAHAGTLGTLREDTGQPAIMIDGTVDGNLFAGVGGDTDTCISVQDPAEIAGSLEVLEETMHFLPVELPTGLPAKTFGSGSQVLQPGDYSACGKLTIGNGQEVVLTGPGSYIFSEIYVKNGGTISANTTGGKVKLYITSNINAPGYIKNFLESGGTGESTNFIIYGTPTCTDILLTGGAFARAIVYAPSAEVVINGGSEFYGALLGKSLEFKGNCAFHYDVSTGQLDDGLWMLTRGGYQIY